jgi:hypothetical protein
MSSISPSFPNGLQAQFGPENTNSSGKAIGSSLNNPDRAAPSSPGSATDNTELSQFAELMSGLRLLQKTNPSEYIAILAEIGASISNEAVGASSVGNVAAASVIAQLEADFIDAGPATQPLSATDPSTA